MKRSIRFRGVLLAAAVSLVASISAANHIRVTNVEVKNQDVAARTADVVFDLSWENSWRSDYPSCTNWDAAWVFVKFRTPNSPAYSNLWEHAKLSASVADHSAPGGTIAVGTDGVDGVGAFIYSASVRTGTVSYARTRLKWNYGASGYSFAKGDGVEVSVQAIEMVYVPEGSFKLGSGGTEYGSFTDGAWMGSGASIPFEINGTWDRQITNAAGKLWGTIQVDASNNAGVIGGVGSVNPDFPSGYNAFYCMKYEITQGQYRDFLNLLTRAQQNTRAAVGASLFALSNKSTLTYRNAVRCPSVIPGAPTNIVFGCDGNANGVFNETDDAMDRACNRLTWAHGAAYSDWAGLRPMTELEFEKACRGPAEPVANEYAWGTSSGTAQTGYAGGADGTGTELASPATANYIGNAGPVRVGIYATNNATRATAGASYWGVMELSGNLTEQTVWVRAEGGRSFTGVHGDGILTAAGGANVSAWPTSTSDGVGYRGWISNFDWARVSCRDYAPNTADGGYNYIGWRGVRSAP